MAAPKRIVAGLLLTGGASRRMGSDKALLEFGGQRLVDRAAAVLSTVAAPVIEVGPGWAPGLCCVREDPPGSGPLAALWAGVEALRAIGADAPAVLALAVDMPAVSTALLRFLAERPGASTVVPRSGGRPQPLCARYGAAALALIPGLLSSGERSLQSLLAAAERDAGGMSWVEPEEWGSVAGVDAFCDLDTPDDLSQHLERLAGNLPTVMKLKRRSS